MASHNFILEARQCGANGLSSSGFCRSDTRLRDIAVIDPRKAFARVKSPCWPDVRAKPQTNKNPEKNNGWVQETCGCLNIICISENIAGWFFCDRHRAHCHCKWGWFRARRRPLKLGQPQVNTHTHTFMPNKNEHIPNLTSKMQSWHVFQKVPSSVATALSSRSRRCVKIAVWLQLLCGCGMRTNPMLPALPAQIAWTKQRASSTLSAPRRKHKTCEILWNLYVLQCLSVCMCVYK